MHILKINLSQTDHIEIYLILITKFAKLIQFWRNILQICQNMYDFGEISLTCLTKYAIFFFELVKLWQTIKLNARYLENKTKLRMSFRNYFNFCTFFIVSSPGHRPCELLSWVGIRRPSVSFSHLTLLLWNRWTDFN